MTALFKNTNFCFFKSHLSQGFQKKSLSPFHTKTSPEGRDFLGFWTGSSLSDMLHGHFKFKDFLGVKLRLGYWMPE
jgi:hypothetical protein